MVGARPSVRSNSAENPDPEAMTSVLPDRYRTVVPSLPALISPKTSVLNPVLPPISVVEVPPLTGIDGESLGLHHPP